MFTDIYPAWFLYAVMVAEIVTLAGVAVICAFAILRMLRDYLRWWIGE